MVLFNGSVKAFYISKRHLVIFKGNIISRLLDTSWGYHSLFLVHELLSIFNNSNWKPEILHLVPGAMIALEMFFWLQMFILLGHLPLMKFLDAFLYWVFACYPLSSDYCFFVVLVDKLVLLFIFLALKESPIWQRIANIIYWLQNIYPQARIDLMKVIRVCTLCLAIKSWTFWNYAWE